MKQNNTDKKRFADFHGLLLWTVIVLVTISGPADAAKKKVLIVKDAKISIYADTNPNAEKKPLIRLSILEISGTETMYQRNWLKVRYIDMKKSAVRDTTGFIEIAPDLKDIVPVSSLRNATLHLSLEPPATVSADLMDIKWSYTGTMHEDVQEGMTEYEEIVKEYYEIACRLFVPEKVDGIILDQPESYYHAYNEKDAIRRVKSVKSHPAWAEVFREKILSGFITERMTRDMVRASWGAPRRIKKGVPQIWLYGTVSQPLQVEFLKGRVTAWSK